MAVDIGAIIGAGATIASGATAAAAGGKMNKRAVRYAREAQEKNHAFAREQNQWNLDMWIKSNEYNSPANQIQLLKDAGLNPLLFAPDGMTTAPIQSADLQTAEPIYNDPAAGSMMQQGIQNIGVGAQQGLDYILHKKETEARIENLNAQSENVKEDTKLLTEKIGLTKAEADQAIKSLDLMNAQIDQLRSSVSMNDFQKELQSKQFYAFLDKQAVEIKSMLKGIELSDVEITKIKAEIKSIAQDCLLKGEQITATKISNAIQDKMFHSTDERINAELDKNRAEVYNASSNVITKVVDYFQEKFIDVWNAKPIGSKSEYNPYDHQNRFGHENPRQW